MVDHIEDIQKTHHYMGIELNIQDQFFSDLNTKLWFNYI